VAGRVVGRAAHQGLVHLDVEAKVVAQPRDDLDRLGHDLGADPVAGSTRMFLLMIPFRYVKSHGASMRSRDS